MATFFPSPEALALLAPNRSRCPDPDLRTLTGAQANTYTVPESRSWTFCPEGGSDPSSLSKVRFRAIGSTTGISITAIASSGVTAQKSASHSPAGPRADTPRLWVFFL